MARSFDKPDGDEKKQDCVAAGTNDRSQDDLPQLPLPRDDDDDEQDAGPILPLDPAEIQEEAEEGQHLLLNFVRTELERNGYTPDCLSQLDQRVDHGISPERVLNYVRAGRELRQLADAFSRSMERETVRRRAKEVEFESLNYEHFFQLLQELFQGGGITRERILVLFFFCADVAIEALKRGFNTTFLRRLVEWSLKYMATYVALWVRKNGGWGAVLNTSLNIAYRVSACCAFIAFTLVCVVYLRRNY